MISRKGSRWILAALVVAITAASPEQGQAAGEELFEVEVSTSTILVNRSESSPVDFSLDWQVGNLSFAFSTTVPAGTDPSTMEYGGLGPRTLVLKTNVYYPVNREMVCSNYASVALVFQLPCSDFTIGLYENDGDTTTCGSITSTDPTLGEFDGYMMVTASQPVVFDVSCQCGPASELPRLTADGESTAYASVLGGEPGCSWGFDGDSLGCEIIGSVTNGYGLVTGVIIQSGKKGGRVTVLATKDGCEYRGTLALTCGESDDGDEPGSCNGGTCNHFGGGGPSLTSEGPGFTASMGADGPESHGGLFWLDPSSGWPLCAPESLNYTLLSLETEGIFGPGNILRQAMAAAGLADIVVTATNSSGVVVAYEIRFYRSWGVGAKASGVYPVTNSAALSCTWGIQNPDASGATTNRLRIVETRSSASWTNDFEYVISDGKWKLTDPVTPREIRAYAQTEGTGTNRVREVFSGATLLSRKVWRYEALTSGSTNLVLTQLREGDGSQVLTTTNTYYTNATPVSWKGRLKQVNRPDGNWTIYEYDGSGRVSREFSAFADQGPTTNAALCRLTEYSYTLDSSGDGVSDDGQWMPMEPRKIIVSVKGHEISRTYRKITQAERTEKVSPFPAPSGNWNNATNLTTTTRYYVGDANDGRVKEIVHPDLTYTTFSYTATAGGGQVITNRVGQASGGVVINGTEAVTTYGDRGELLSRVTRPVVNGSVTSVKLVDDVFTYTDDLNLAHTLVSFGTLTNEVDYNCCGVSSETDRDGATTSYTYDSLHRRVAATSYDITTTNILDAAGRVLVRKRIGSDLSTMTLDQYGYDSLGRVSVHTNALGGVTTYAEGVTNSKLNRLTINPDQGQRLEIYCRDARLEAVTNNAASPVRYVYDVEQDGAGGPWRETTLEIRYDGAGNTNEWTKTFLDGAGRAYKTVYAAASGAPYRLSTFNNLGQLIKERDPDGVTTLYQYNAQGERDYTVIDLDLDGVVDFTGPDRVTCLRKDYLTYDSKDAARTLQTRYTAFGASTTNALSQVVASADGLKTWSSVYRDGSTPVTTTNVVAYGPGNGSRTNTVFRPDGSRTESVYSYGRLQSVTARDSAGNQLSRSTYAYDYHGRVYSVTDARNGATVYVYNNADQVSAVTTPTPGTGEDSQTTVTFFDSSGRVSGQWLPDGSTTTNLYSPSGLLVKTWGSRQYPVAYGYDAQGRMKTMTTWQAFNQTTGLGNQGAVTTWNYDPYRGWLASKDYPDAGSGNAGTLGPDYTYTAGGRLKTRTWARNVPGTGNRIVTTYLYGFESGTGTNLHGDLIQVSYNDGTTNVSRVYDRAGRLSSVTTGSRAVGYGYNDADRLLTESVTGGMLSGWSVTNVFNGMLQRTNVTLKRSTTDRQKAVFAYDAGGRLSTVTDGLVTTLKATYGYEPNSTLVASLSLTNVGSSQGLVTLRSYDGLNRLRTVSSRAYGSSAPSLPVSFGYQLNAANQRIRTDREDGSFWIYQYDELGQVVSGRRYWADGTEVAGQQFDYRFDAIGNRTQAGGRASAVGNYTNNLLNQLTGRSVAGVVDVLGIANPTAAVTVNGSTAARKGEYFHYPLAVNNASAAQYPTISVISQYGSKQTNAGSVFVPPAAEINAFDADGNLTSDGRWLYTWDAENRLVEMRRDAASPSGARQKLAFEYDHQGRRIRKTFFTHNGSSWVEQSDVAFAYDGWNLLAEVDANDGNEAWLRTYLWGLDLSGTEQGAGGVGGLLKVTDATSGTTHHWVACDGNGNVAALISTANGSLSASYDYGPFGEAVRATGPYAKKNPFRFSTKFTDDQTGLLYYGHRYYEPSLGKWQTRDPIGKTGGANVYGFVHNDPLGFVDLHGLADAPTAPALKNPIPETERDCCDEAKVKKGEDELRRRFKKAGDDAKKLGLAPASPPNPLWPWAGGGAATCKNSSQDVLEYLLPTPACWQCYLEERNAYSPKDDPKDERRDHQVVICVGYLISGAKKEIILDWWGGETSADKFRREYQYPARFWENPYWTRCSDGEPNKTPPPCSGWQCSRPPVYE